MTAILDTLISIRIQIEAKDETSQLIPSCIKRVAAVNGDTVYDDRMSVEMYSALDDPIRNLELFLLGQKKTESCSNVGCNTRKKRCFLAHIWRKFFGKKF